VIVKETVILPLPDRIRDISAAAYYFEAQYRCKARTEIKGFVQMETGALYHMKQWRTIIAKDFEYGMIGLGHDGDDERTLLWVIPWGPGKMRLSAQEGSTLEG
jgi:hypothetical protein